VSGATTSSVRGKARPKRIKILNLTYTVVFVRAEEMKVSGAFGWCDHELQIIGIADDQPLDAMQDTFLHEILHAITNVMDLGDEEKEETFVRRLATGLCTVWKANPSAWSWWQSLG